MVGDEFEMCIIATCSCGVAWASTVLYSYLATDRLYNHATTVILWFALFGTQLLCTYTNEKCSRLR